MNKPKFHLDYTQKTLKLFFNGEEFIFDLNDGDVGDFWKNFTTKGGMEYEVNLMIDEDSEFPDVTIYDIGGHDIEGKQIFDCLITGNKNDYIVPVVAKKKVAKLVYVSMVTRVIVDEDATEDQIINASKFNLIDKIRTDLYENVEEIVDDEEVPYCEKEKI